MDYIESYKNIKRKCIDKQFGEFNVKLNKLVSKLPKKLKILIILKIKEVEKCSKNILINYLNLALYTMNYPININIDKFYRTLYNGILKAINAEHIENIDIICSKKDYDIDYIYGNETIYKKDTYINLNIKAIILGTRNIRKLYKLLHSNVSNEIIWIDNVIQEQHIRGSFIPELCGAWLSGRSREDFTCEPIYLYLIAVDNLTDTCNKCLDYIREIGRRKHDE